MGELDLDGLVSAEVTAFVLREARLRRIGSMKALLSPLRTLMRFLFVAGMVSPGSHCGVPYRREPAARLKDTEVPPKGLVPSQASRTTQYLLSAEQITALMTAARRRPSPLRAVTFETLIGLMAVTGLRTGEAMALDRADVDLAQEVITVWRSKLGKSRQVPVHQITTTTLVRYDQVADHVHHIAAAMLPRAPPRPHCQAGVGNTGSMTAHSASVMSEG